MTPWKSEVRPPRDGEAVSGAVAARGHRDGAQRAQHVKERLDALEAGHALVLRDQPVNSSLLPVQPVYQDDAGVWQPALATGTVSENQVSVTLAPSALAVGLVLRKLTSTTADIILYGRATFTDISAAIPSGFLAGLQYLSGDVAGRLSASRPAIPVPLAVIRGPDTAGVYTAFVIPSAVTELDSHRHIRHVLFSVPAGTPNSVPSYDGFPLGTLDPDGPYPGTVHAIEAEDPEAPGWLPADSTVFDGLRVPDGAYFGYNLSKDPVLSVLWPPVPASMAYVEVNGVGAGEATVVVNGDGIWWMDNRYGKAPWSPNYGAIAGSSSSSSSSAGPDLFQLDIVLWFTRLIFGTGGPVTSLASTVPVLSVEDLGGNPASVGDLRLSALPFTPIDLPGGGKALVSLDLQAGTVSRSSVVNGLRLEDPEFELNGGSADDQGYRSGYLSLRRSALSLIAPDLKVVALNNAEEVTYRDTLLLRLPASRDSAIRARFEVPFFSAVDGLQAEVTVYFTFLALTDALSLPAQNLTLAYRRIPRPDGCSALALPLADTAHDFSDLCADTLSVNTYVEAASLPIPVVSGDTLYIELDREAADFAIGIVRMSATITFVEG